MKIYADLILFINFFLDLFLLIGVSLILKRNVKIIRMILGAIAGSISLIALFININSYTLFLIKVIISIIMILISFGYKNVKYTMTNLSYLYLLSIVLGGFLYFINDNLSYKNIGLIFFYNGFSINIILILLLSPIIIYLYVKRSRSEKKRLSSYYKVSITFLNGNTRHLTAFLDTGNNLYDPYKKRPIIIINESIIGDYKPKYILVPCYTVNKESILKCFKIKELVINGKIIEKECLVGISDNNFNLDGIDCLLHEGIMEGLE